mmetsp:Transcript_8134/g.14893  ORF Transcript_8134/g.14893 Transcript_8134/m.14893 type:complete len:225 (-) Transcript_8134:426-1100(-)
MYWLTRGTTASSPAASASSHPLRKSGCILYVVFEEGIDALLPQIGRTVGAPAGADGGVGELEPALASVVGIVPVPALNVAHDEAPAGTVVGVVAEGLHGEDGPALVVLVGDPAVVRSELGEVTDERLHQVLRATDGVNVAPRDEYLLPDLADAVPVLGVLDGLVGHPEVVPEEFVLEDAKVVLEALAHGLLLVAVPADVSSCVGGAKSSHADNFVPMEPDAVRR